MTSISFSSFSDELEKIASGHSVGSSALELAGLGTLAVPHLYHAATGKDMSKKTQRNAEIAGLGVLAAPYAKHLAGTAWKALKHASVESLAEDYLEKISMGAVGTATKAAPKAGGLLHGAMSLFKKAL